ncbi:MAG: RluA family pseudouridine synthase [Chloroflexi bacterium]|nr:RluA family pseudouridine synthase [Chloroflexota bacterium]
MAGSPIDLAACVLWSDLSLVVINKPPGLLVLPHGYDPDIPYLTRLLEPEFGRLWVVHRLDRETSGVLVLARNARAHHLLNDQFAARQVVKIYHALVVGSPDWDDQQVSQPLQRNGDRRHRTVIDLKWGKPASTDFHVLERFEAYTLIEARPHTGYTHQIRAHLAYLGHPLIADHLYGNSESSVIPSPTDVTLDRSSGRLLLDRVGLHALQITFVHPDSGQETSFTAPYPGDFTSALQTLRSQPLTPSA